MLVVLADRRQVLEHQRLVVDLQQLLGLLIPSDRFTLLASMKSSLPSASSSSTAAGQSGSDRHNVMWTFGHRPEKIPLIPVPRKLKKKRATVVAEKDPNRISASDVLGPAAVASSSSAASSGASRMFGGMRNDRSPAVAKAAGSFFEGLSSSWFGKS